MEIKYATISEKGQRHINQDAVRIAYHPEMDSAVAIVCDGMGGHAFGETASNTVADTIFQYWEDHKETPDTEEKVKKAQTKASVAMDEKTVALGHKEMGTTMVMASIQGNKVTIAHVGDSRCYLLRKGHFDYEDINNRDKDHVVYRTQDHSSLSFGWDMVDRCFFSFRPEKAVPDVAQFNLEPGDRIFLCTDGVHKYVDPDILKARLLDNKAPEIILDTIAFLCERFSDDNYSAVLIIAE